ncbi:MAG: hypothetical protein RL513_111 [Pseudomonadota bacterium]
MSLARPLTTDERAACLAFLSTVSDDALAGFVWMGSAPCLDPLPLPVLESCALYCEAVAASSRDALDAAGTSDEHRASAAHNVKHYGARAEFFRSEIKRMQEQGVAA